MVRQHLHISLDLSYFPAGLLLSAVVPIKTRSLSKGCFALHLELPFSDFTEVMSAPNKTKTKGRKGKSSDGIPSNLEAQASSPAAPPTSAAPRTPTTPQPPSLPAAAAAPSQLTKDKDQVQLFGFKCSVLKLKAQMPTPQRAGPVQQRTGTPRPQQPKSKTKTAVQQQQQQPQSPATPKETIRTQQKAASMPQQQQQGLKDQALAAQHQSNPTAQHKASPRPNQVSHKAAEGVAQVIICSLTCIWNRGYLLSDFTSICFFSTRRQRLPN